jgi:hypothetical protein
MRGPAARFIGIALAAAGAAAAAPASAERYEDGLAAYNRSDYSKSLKLLRAAADKGDERAQYLLGRQFQFGQGVKADRAEAFFWYKRAEAKGHLEAKLFRQLLEKRWKITGDEKGRADRKLAALSAPPKPAPAAIAETAQKIKPEPAKAEKAKAEKAKPEKPTQTAALRESAALKESAAAKEKAKPAPAAERAKPEPAASKPKPETLRTRLQEPPKPETSRAEAAKPAEKPAIVAARNTPETDESPSAVLRGTTSTARMPARPHVRDDEDDGDDGQPRNGSPPPETRTPVAALPTRPPPSDHDGYQYPPSYAPSTPNYPPPSPYYAPGPGPYYAPPPPPWRGFYGPRPQYRPWGYRAHVGYMHPGWRGSRRW